MSTWIERRRRLLVLSTLARATRLAFARQSVIVTTRGWSICTGCVVRSSSRLETRLRCSSSRNVSSLSIEPSSTTVGARTSRAAAKVLAAMCNRQKRVRARTRRKRDSCAASRSRRLTSRCVKEAYTSRALVCCFREKELVVQGSSIRRFPHDVCALHQDERETWSQDHR